MEGLFVTLSQDIAKEMWKLLESVLVCAFQKVLQGKGVCVGWQNGNKERMVKSVKVFLMEYWKNNALFMIPHVSNSRKDIEKDITFNT